MLSNPTTALHNRQRQRQHRRQQSTPNAFEAVKASNLPTIQRHNSHRRGMSLDQRRRTSPAQDYTTRNTNPGYQSTQPQHILRETQQQRLARPGQRFAQYDNDENCLNSPCVTPQRQSFDAGCTNQYGHRLSQSQFQFPGPINTIIQVDPNSFNGNQDFNNMYQPEVMTPSAYLDFSAGFENASQGTNSACHSRRNSAGRRISGGILDRVNQFEHLALQSPCRPITPTNQNVSRYFPPTPVDTPHDRMVKQEQMNQRFLDTYDSSMEETIKPKGNQRARGIFDDMRKAAEGNYMPSSPQAGTVVNPHSFDSAPMPTANFMNMSNINLEFLKDEQLSSPQFPPNDMTPSMSFHPSHASSPAVMQDAMFGDPFVNKLGLEPNTMSYPEHVANLLPMSNSPSHRSHQSHHTHHPSHRRSESVDSINLEESITDTGITIDDIANFISGPDPSDGKWICLYPECKKRFGRKENIKSHVQTHLGDRQFQCPHCKKCFVRQHDLKRHAKIHSGVKPYPCQCGNSFARHDALTRHRQRGMCIGALEGVVKKVVKRGRPRKNRPDTEERVNKASRTRSKNKTASSMSSSTSGSESRGGPSPRSEADILDDKPFANYEYTQQSHYMQQSSAPERASFEYSHPRSPTPSHCVSPQAIHPARHSPSAESVRSHRASIASSTHGASHPASPAKSMHSSYHSPPGLCESSSSPAASIYYDLDIGNHHDGATDHLNGLAHLSEHDNANRDDEMFLEAFAAASSGEMLPAAADHHHLSMAKFEDAFAGAAEEEGGAAAASAEPLFRDSEDVFFGSP
ncbi:uncharacterized protein L3040_003546 [Drepanopeziza brunnea f. sp. 'multigermtubi']|uniref:C2H2 transcription factor Swi5 n=1 Tax=Marssonina brunnea f. sp. multigermtubi (strain MB_m1) TaxID=1072389 RepID=K1WJ67_MARBU|nr:C2H2 transcription factor Swi5 [Drepanopeziza brunnea f. sp. 'multigermtubi' MB_m1]EKD17665.1 C2H2 transcription factor Swi5 [Drepanopeziza brunnea f. sp. 'multigermtubi' MB_m1]KAJ5046299.1 hypothetical protein L3040_003546 [Drepanopeziza brunnea f. sp. 'multigermtubi']